MIWLLASYHPRQQIREVHEHFNKKGVALTEKRIMNTTPREFEATNHKCHNWFVAKFFNSFVTTECSMDCQIFDPCWC